MHIRCPRKLSIAGQTRLECSRNVPSCSCVINDVVDLVSHLFQADLVINDVVDLVSHLFQADLTGGQQSAAKQHRPYSTAVDYTENAKFSSLLFPIGKYSANIFDTPGIFILHSKYILTIPTAFFWILDARTVFGSHSASILTAFIQHSMIQGTFQLDFRRVIPAAVELHSYGIRSAFWTLRQHSEYSYSVSTTFKLHSKANTLGMRKNHLMRVRSEFVVFERHSYKILLKWHSRLNVTRILNIVNPGWYCFIPALVWRGF